MEAFSKEAQSVWERCFEKTMNSRWNSREKLKKFWKTILKTQNTRFSQLDQVASKSPGLAAKTLKDKIVKNFLSVFRDWKVYPQGSCKPSQKNLCVTLVTGPLTREQVAKINTRARGWISRLGWPTTESPKQGNTIFEIFQFL